MFEATASSPTTESDAATGAVVAGCDGAPGPGLAGALAAVDVQSLQGEALAEVIAGCERLISWAHARQLAAITVLGSRMEVLVDALPEGPGFAVDAGAVTVAEVAVALTVSESTGTKVALAGRLADLPGTAAALAGGVIDLGRVRAITEATAVLSRDAARAVEDRVLVRAPGQTAAQLRRSLGRAVYAVDPGAAEKRHAAAARTRRVAKRVLPDGIGGIWIEGPADGTVALHTALTILAARARERDRAAARATGASLDEPGMDARRFDALVAWAKAVIAHQDDLLRPAWEGRPENNPGAGRATGRDAQQEAQQEAQPDADNEPDGPDVSNEPDVPDVNSEPEVNNRPDQPHQPGDRGTYGDPEDPGPDDPGERSDGDQRGDYYDGDDPRDDDSDESRDYDRGRFRGGGCWLGSSTVIDPNTGEVYSSADVLVDPLTGEVHPRQLASRMPARRPGRGATQLHVTVAAETLLGTSEAPGELTGYGPIPASMARRLTPGSVLRRLLTEPVTGKLLDFGTTTYVVPANLAGHVMVRDGTCRGPGCGRPAAGCDLDHTVPYPEGSTRADNLGAGCRHHQLFKTAGLWAVVQIEDGVFAFRTATGLHRTVRPADLREGFHLMRQGEDDNDTHPHDSDVA